MGTHRKRVSKDTLSRNQDFDLLRQKNKQTSSISLKASKLAVFLAGSEFRLRIPFGKRICFPSPSAASKLLCLQSERMSKGIRFLLYIQIMKRFIIDIFCLAKPTVNILLIAVFSAVALDACAFAQGGCCGNAVMDFCQTHEKNSFRLL